MMGAMSRDQSKDAAQSVLSGAACTCSRHGLGHVMKGPGPEDIL